MRRGISAQFLRFRFFQSRMGNQGVLGYLMAGVVLPVGTREAGKRVPRWPLGPRHSFQKVKSAHWNSPRISQCALVFAVFLAGLIPRTSPRMSNGTDAIPATENWSPLAYVFKIRKVKRLQMLGDANVFRGFAEFGRCSPGRRGCLSGDGTHSRNHSKNPKPQRFLFFWQRGVHRQ